MLKAILIFSVLFFISSPGTKIKLPVSCTDRSSVECIELTDIGIFGLWRKERKGFPAHFHTGVDIKRPNANYVDEPIFPISDGIVISKRDDGPYAQLIIEHNEPFRFWTVYEHVAGISVNLNDYVDTETPMARFMSREELDRFGWQFDHLHFEVLKSRPVSLKPDNSKPERRFGSYSLVCYTKEDLDEHFYDPFEFFRNN